MAPRPLWSEGYYDWKKAKWKPLELPLPGKIVKTSILSLEELQKSVPLSRT